MAKQNCSACDDLRTSAPNLLVNGLGDTECTSLQNNTGLNPSNSNNDCTDLNNMNDCLIGNMEAEVDAYEVCDWKPFMKRYIPNIWTTMKGVICAVCGIWKNIQNILSRLNKLECQVKFLSQGTSFSFGENDTNTKSHIVAGKGVSFLNVDSSGTASDVRIRYIGGGLGQVYGSCLFYTANFNDRTSIYNYDNNGVNPRFSKERKGNSIWNGRDTKPGNAGSELVYEIRILKSEFPQIKSYFGGRGQEARGGAFHSQTVVFTEGEYAYGQRGSCDTLTGKPIDSNNDSGHKVPSGWIYIQMRISWIDYMNANATGRQYSPSSWIGMRINQNAISC